MKKKKSLNQSKKKSQFLSQQSLERWSLPSEWVSECECVCVCVGTMSALACGHELIIGMLLVNIPASIDETLLVIY